MKIKIAISLISIAIMFSISMINKKLESNLVYKRWGDFLTWKDFIGPVPLFSKYSAAVNCGISLEFDSTLNAYRAFSFQTNLSSWVKPGEQNAYGLNHEQYHFNIAEVHARMLNNFIATHPRRDKPYYKLRLDSVGRISEKMQMLYDAQTEHSLSRGQQRRWEYRIDSLLAVNSDKSDEYIDYYSNCSIYFPVKPQQRIGFSEKGAYRAYELDRYDMHLIMTSYHLNDVPTTFSSFMKMCTAMPLIAGSEILAVSSDSIDRYWCRINSKSSGFKTQNVIFQRGKLIHQLTCAYPDVAADSTGYQQIISSFVNSFKFAHAGEHWREKATQIPHNVLPDPKGDRNRFSCLLSNDSKKMGLSEDPLKMADGSILIPYYICQHPDSLIQSYRIRINNRYFESNSFGAEHIYRIPAELISDKMKVDVGYIAKNDSIGNCGLFYFETFSLDGVTKTAKDTQKRMTRHSVHQ